MLALAAAALCPVKGVGRGGEGVQGHNEAADWWRVYELFPPTTTPYTHAHTALHCMHIVMGLPRSSHLLMWHPTTCLLTHSLAHASPSLMPHNAQNCLQLAGSWPVSGQ